MSSLLVIAAIAVICIGWVRANRRARQAWVRRLDLPGIWDWQEHDGILELAGHLDGGQYRLLDDGEEERGAWTLQGHQLVLTPRRGSPASLDLRLFTDGKIGLHGQGREHRIYIKRRGNVVPLRRPA